MSIGLGTRGLHKGRVPLVAPVVPIPIIRRCAHAESGIDHHGPTYSCSARDPPHRAADGRTRDASNADHDCLNTPGFLGGNKQPSQRSAGDTDEKDRLAHLAPHWPPSVARGATKAIRLRYFSWASVQRSEE